MLILLAFLAAVALFGLIGEQITYLFNVADNAMTKAQAWLDEPPQEGTWLS